MDERKLFRILYQKTDLRGFYYECAGFHMCKDFEEAQKIADHQTEIFTPGKDCRSIETTIHEIVEAEE